MSKKPREELLREMNMIPMSYPVTLETNPLYKQLEQEHTDLKALHEKNQGERYGNIVAKYYKEKQLKD